MTLDVPVEVLARAPRHWEVGTGLGVEPGVLSLPVGRSTADHGSSAAAVLGPS